MAGVSDTSEPTSKVGADNRLSDSFRPVCTDGGAMRAVFLSGPWAMGALCGVPVGRGSKGLFSNHFFIIVSL